MQLLAGRPTRLVRATRERLPDSARDFAGFLIGGSAASLIAPPAWVEPLLELVREALRARVPVLGICFGHQVLARALCGPAAVRRSARGELGWTAIERTASNALFDGLEPRFECFVSHFDEIAPELDELDVFARSEHCAVQAFEVRGAPAWGVQFHPEMPLEEARELVLSNSTAHGIDAERALRRAPAHRGELGARIAANFLRLAEGG